MGIQTQAVILTGTIAAGKTTLAEAVSELLHERGIRHALLDLDWLGQVYPTPEGHDPFGYGLALQNLKNIWPNFRAVGAEKAVVAATLLNRDQRQKLHEALGGIPMVVALVTAPSDVLRDRVRQRDFGALKDDFLARTATLALEIEAERIHDFEVRNDGASREALALDILAKLEWIPPS